uniref:Peptidase M13 N-terminal domain-containing protein n=2 Tax=Plectus sambesii TaxID=2011161 RepID=A0A914WYQ8_9BILA
MPSATYEVQAGSQPPVSVNLGPSQPRRESRRESIGQRRKVYCYILALVLFLAVFAVIVGIAIALFASPKRTGHDHSAAALTAPSANQDRLARSTVSDGLSASSLDENTCKKAVCLDYAADLLQTMDLNTSPCDNFHRFSCARKKPQKSLKSVISALQDALETSPNAGSPFAHLFKSLYNDCKRSESLERSGIQPLLGLITRVGGCPLIEGTHFDQTSYKWEQQLANLSLLGVHPLIDIGLTATKNEAGEMLKYVHLTIAAPKRKDAPSSTDMRERMVRVIRLLGQEPYEPWMEEVIQFTRNVHQSISPLPKASVAMSYEELKASTVGIGWNALLDGVFDKAELQLLDDEELIFVNDLASLQKIGKLVAGTPRRILANYLIWTLIDSMQAWLPLQYRTVLDSKIRQTEESRTEQCIVEFLSKTDGFLRSFILNDVWSDDTGYNAISLAGELTDDDNSHSVLIADRAGIRRLRIDTAPVVWTNGMTVLEKWIAVLQQQSITSLKTVRTLAVKLTDDPSAAFLLKADPLLQDDVPTYLRYGALGPLVRCRILTETSSTYCLESIMQIYDDKYSHLTEKTLPGFQAFSAPQIILLLFANSHCDDRVKATNLQHLVDNAFSCH